jgi:large subunit ribosomal protein L18
MKSQEIKLHRRERRARHVRKRIRRTTSLPRLCVSRSLKHISAQVIDDATGRTLASATTASRALADALNQKNKTDRARVIGTELARKAREAGVEAVVLDRGFARYHGRVKALADAARAGGLKF